MSLYVPVIFKNKAGRRVKSFHLNGVHALEKVLFWLWREIFVSMLASDLEHHKILAMLRDIESTFGWQALERVIVGGESGRSSSDIYMNVLLTVQFSIPRGAGRRRME